MAGSIILLNSHPPYSHISVRDELSSTTLANSTLFKVTTLSPTSRATGFAPTSIRTPSRTITVPLVDSRSVTTRRSPILTNRAWWRDTRSSATTIPPGSTERPSSIPPDAGVNLFPATSRQLCAARLPARPSRIPPEEWPPSSKLSATLNAPNDGSAPVGGALPCKGSFPPIAILPATLAVPGHFAPRRTADHTAQHAPSPALGSHSRAQVALPF